MLKRRLAGLIAAVQVGLGVMYEHGHGVPQDYAQAMKWYRLAAEQGLAKGIGSGVK